MDYDILIPIAILAYLLWFTMMYRAHRNTGTSLIKRLNQKRFRKTRGGLPQSRNKQA